MPDVGAAFQTGPDPKDLLNWEDKEKFQKIFARQAVKSYVFLSFGMGLAAFILPIVLPLVGGYAGHYTISYFYHASDLSRDVLVGLLWTIGVFLLLFHGLSRLENWLLNLAGVMAICVATIPMPKTQDNKGFTVHGASAMVFFACLAIVAVGLSKGRIKYIIHPPKRRRFKIAYNAAGFAMIAMPVTVAAIHFLGGGASGTHWMYWIETLGIWAFSAYWFVKTLEYRLLLRVR